MVEIENVTVADFHSFMLSTNQRYSFSIAWGDVELDLDGIGTVNNVYLHPSEGLTIPVDLTELNTLYVEWLDTQD